MSFSRLQGSLVCDNVALSDLAAAHGTPLYVYSADTIASRYRAADDAFASYPHAMHYALKANSALAIVRLLRSLGSKVDANSGGEIDVALRAGFIPPEIVFTGVGKTEAELTQAIDLGVKTINAESEGELERIDALARARQTRARVAIRVNPDIDARSHPHISTGLKTNKFGVSIDDARDLCRRMRDRAGLEIVGLHTHVGSQIMDLEPLRSAATKIVALATELIADGLAIEHLDLGGGLGISYDGSPAPTPAEYAAAVLPAVRESGLAIVLEPGRSIVGPAGALVTRVVDVKAQPGGKYFVILDAGYDRVDSPDALQRVSTASNRRKHGRHRKCFRMSSARFARAATPSAKNGVSPSQRSATCLRSSTQAPTDRSWRRTTIAGRCPRKSWCRTAAVP